MRLKKRTSARAELGGRDHALALIEETRSYLVGIASQIAYDIVKERGTVTSTEVWNILRARAENNVELRDRLENSDPRWMGAVFNRSKWRRVSWNASGSHKRPVSVWELQPELPFPK